MSKIAFNLQSLYESIEKIECYSHDFNDAESFYHDQKSFDATMMQFVVIGEIVSRLDDTYKQQHTQISWQQIKNFRNIIAHDYFGIDADEIWDIIQSRLLPLKNDILQLLNTLER